MPGRWGGLYWCCVAIVNSIFTGYAQVGWFLADSNAGKRNPQKLAAKLYCEQLRLWSSWVG
jgi:hypothetical protein